MIIRENTIKIDEVSKEFFLDSDNIKSAPEEMIFFDLEHYVYKKPKCIGVFGACIFDKVKSELRVTQYMIENKIEGQEILTLAKKYFEMMKESGKKAIVTFSGNNDFSVINYLFNKNNIEYVFSEEFELIDIQKEYERVMDKSIGLKNLEKDFDIHRECEVISGSNLAKTFQKIINDKEYIERIPKEKIEKILLYNEQDVVSLYHIFVNWKKYINNEKEENCE